MNNFYRHTSNPQNIPNKPYSSDRPRPNFAIGQIQILEEYMDKSFPDMSSILPTREQLESVFCECNGNGHFIMFHPRHPSVLEGEKNYCTCNVCGCVSHI